ncbi:MAG: S9 family peptidase [Microlunatus sp.]|nr:S9 family peptidase [Microlunatus sp.]
MTQPFGSWPSSITAESLTEGALGLGEVAFDGSDLYWLQAKPTEGGRVSLWRRSGDRETELTPAPYNVRSRVHEYGGGAFAAAGGLAVFSNFTDNLLHLVSDRTDQPRQLTGDSALRYAALKLYPERGLIIAVREDHRDADHEAINTVIARRIGDGPDGQDIVLCSGADFYASPELSDDGRLAWVEWDHPNMPWDSTRLLVAELPDDLAAVTGPLESHQVAGGDGESVAVPRWLPDSSLIFVSDRSDWWNLYSYDGGRFAALHPQDAEFAPPQWALGSQPFVVVDGDHLACSWNVGNRSHLGVLRLSTGALTELPIGATSIGLLTTDGSRIATVAGYPDRPAALVVIDIESAGTTVVRRASESGVPAELITEPVEVSWDSDQGPVHGWFFPPRNGDLEGDEGELPPMITLSHGGPTGGSAPDFDPGILFWTSRGIAVLDVNYGGSTGYGRRYRERLRHNWGIVDVADCAAGAAAMADQGRADRARLAIKGGSAGGYTTLRALTATKIFTAGISLFGIGDITALATDTHKFESRYPDSLVGPYPEAADVYADRSPINHVDQLTSPILLLQGAEDRVVPPNQAETFAAAARAKGLPVALIMYDGEGHGFRRSENIINSVQAQLTFLGRVFDFTPADDLPPLKIENL